MIISQQELGLPVGQAWCLNFDIISSLGYAMLTTLTTTSTIQSNIMRENILFKPSKVLVYTQLSYAIQR